MTSKPVFLTGSVLSPIQLPQTLLLKNARSPQQSKTGPSKVHWGFVSLSCLTCASCWMISSAQAQTVAEGLTNESGILVGIQPDSRLITQLPQLPPTQDPSPQRPSEPLPVPETPSLPPSPENLFPTPLPTPETPEPVPGEVPETITIKQFDFEGNTVISDEELATATAQFLNRPLPFTQVFEVRSIITELYRQRGYITSGAIIPPQTFQQDPGIVKVQVLEGGLETINVTGTRQLNPDYIRDRLALAAGTPLNRNQLLQALQLLQLDPLIETLSAELSAGVRPGTSLLTVQVQEAKTFSTDLSFNNNRSPSIGTFERQITLREANLTGEGDGLSVSYSNTAGSHTLDANYTYPINPRNGTLNLRYSKTFSEVVEPPFDRIDIDADAQYLALTWRQPLLQTLSEEFAIGVSLTHQDSDVTIFDIPVRLSPGADENGQTSVSALRFFQEWTQRSNRSVFAVRSQFSIGVDFLNSTINKDAPDSRFQSWRGQVQWLRLLGPDTLLILRGDVQLATDSLLRLEQFGLGGQDTIRGYRENVFLSDNGVLASAELRFPILRLPRWDGLLQLAPFVDIGAVWNNSRNLDPEPDPNILVSTGLGLRLQLGDRVSARFDWGIPLVDVISSERTLQENGLYFSIFYRVF